jgi:hypothetical protein
MYETNEIETNEIEKVQIPPTIMKLKKSRSTNIPVA